MLWTVEILVYRTNNFVKLHLPQIALSFVAFLIFGSDVTFADAENGLEVYKDVDDALTSQSKVNLRSLVQQAQIDGSITVWVDFGIPFQANPLVRTPEVIEHEHEQLEQAIESIILPLVRTGHASIVNLNPAPMAPGCMIEASPSALEILAHKPGVKYLGYFKKFEEPQS